MVATAKHTIHYKPGELHAVQLDDNTVALVMPTDYAATVRDVVNLCVGNDYSTRRKYTSMIWRALNFLKDFPDGTSYDIRSRDGNLPGIEFQPNEAVKF